MPRTARAGVVTAAPVDLLDRLEPHLHLPAGSQTSKSSCRRCQRSVQATETLTLSGLAYYRKFKSNVIDGNLSEPVALRGGSLRLVPFGSRQRRCRRRRSRGQERQPVPSSIGDPLGSIERINQDARSYGGSMQAVEKAKVFDRPTSS